MASRKKRSKKSDTAEAGRLLAQLKDELRSFESTHPHLVQTVDELCSRLAALGI